MQAGCCICYIYRTKDGLAWRGGQTGRVHNSDRCATPRHATSVVSAIHCRWNVGRSAGGYGVSTDRVHTAALPPGRRCRLARICALCMTPVSCHPHGTGYFSPPVSPRAHTAYRNNLGRADNWTTDSDRVSRGNILSNC